MSFGNPLLLVTLLVVPATLGIVALARRRSSRFAVSFPNLPVLARVATRAGTWRRAVPLVALLLALSAIGVAVARPHVSLRVPTERATVVLVVDISRSMLSEDVAPSRLEAAKAAAQTFMEHVPESLRVGLVTFSGDVTVPVLPTEEQDLVRDAVAAIDPYSGFGGGTAIGDAIARAVEVGSTTLSRDEEGIQPEEVGGLMSILFLSDGRQNRGILPPLEGAALAQDAGIAVHTVALGKEGGAGAQQPGFGGGGGSFGGGRNRAPDPETLQAIAELTGGEFTWARTAEELDAAYADLGSRVGRSPQRTEVTAAFVAVGAVALLVGALSGALWSPRLP
jgi:Ca-activated chloride channel homolog